MTDSQDAQDTTTSGSSPLELLNSQRRQITVDYYDFSIRELLSMMVAGELNISPSYQRQFRWDEVAESLLIESIFLELPIPSLFAAIDKDFSWEIVDGLQRLSTLAHFVAEPPELTNKVARESPLRLDGLEKLPFLNGKRFSDLDADIRKYFIRRTMRITALGDQSDKEARFDLFERLNRGSVRLTEQEVRACVYQGAFLDFVEELAADERFVQLTKLQVSDEKNGTREELVLKFFAYLFDREEFKGRVDKFLNQYTAKALVSFDFDHGRQLFEKTVATIHQATNGEPFLRSATSVTPKNQLEAVLVGVGEILHSGAVPSLPSGQWLEDAELVSASTGGTNPRSMLKRRVDRARELFTSAKP